MTDEEQYFETRAEQWEDSRRLSRAQLLKLGAAVPLLAGASRLLPADVASAASLADPPIRKPLPPEWFVVFGTNAEMRWDSVAGLGYTTPNERFFVRNHTSHARHRPGDLAAARLRHRRCAGGRRRVHLRASCGGCPRTDDRRHRVRRQRAQLLRAPSRARPRRGTQWRLGAIGVATLARRAAVRACCERAGITPGAVDVLPEGLDANVVSGGVDQGRVRRPLPVAQGARRRAGRATR